MTPLAMQIWEQKRLPIAQRTFKDAVSLARLDDFHCFDVNAVFELCKRMSLEMLAASDFDRSLAFLPAEKTWLEFVYQKQLVGALLEKHYDAAKVSIFNAVSVQEISVMPLGDAAGRKVNTMQAAAKVAIDDGMKSLQLAEHLNLAGVDGFKLILLAALALINGPGLCPQRLCHHSRPVAKRLGLRVNGSFPLQAWTELTLRVGPGEQKSWTGGRQGGRTDMMPLHFVRAHRRRINGEWRKIEAFWRGNAALGIKQTRYNVKPREQSDGA